MEFVTTNGKWTPKLSMMMVLDINKEYNINLLDLRSGSLAAIGNDLSKFFAILWESVKAEVETKGISQQQFVNGFENGDQIEAGYNALVDAITPFFKKPQKELLDKFLNKWDKVDKLGYEEAMKRVEDIDINDIKKAMEEEDKKKDIK